MNSWLKNYKEILLLITGIIIGSIAGAVLGDKVKVIKPIGDIFLNLLFTAVVPLVFFAVVSAISGLNKSQKLGKILGITSLVFVGTVLVAAIVTILAIWIFPIHQHLVASPITESVSEKPFGDQLTNLFTTSEFFHLLSRQSMLAMIIFAVITGFAILNSGEKGKPFADFVHSGNEVFKNIFILIMKMGPVGLGAYFAYQVGVFGPQLFGGYARSMALYYSVGAFYYLFIFSLYAFTAGGVTAFKRYWNSNLIPSATAVGTCSSIATIPANMDAAKKMGIPDAIANITVPLGGTLHKEGSSISSIVKMAVVFALFGRSFDNAETITIALGVTVLVSLVEGGIPNGGYIGELLFISAYGFPPEALPPAIIIGTLVDPMATLLNATGDTVASMLVSRLNNGKNWQLPENQLADPLT